MVMDGEGVEIIIILLGIVVFIYGVRALALGVMVINNSGVVVVASTRNPTNQSQRQADKPIQCQHSPTLPTDNQQPPTKQTNKSK